MRAIRVGVGALAVLIVLATVAASVPRTSVSAQPQSPGPLPATPVQTIKVLIAPSSENGTDCEFQPPSHAATGVHPGDSLIWNLENGCAASATFRLHEPRSIFPPKYSGHALLAGSEKWPKEVTVPGRDRRQVAVRVAPARSDDPDPVGYEYDIEISIAKSAKPGQIYFCKMPPCPPPWIKPIK